MTIILTKLSKYSTPQSSRLLQSRDLSILTHLLTGEFHQPSLHLSGETFDLHDARDGASFF